jgi:hypothetical protein
MPRVLHPLKADDPTLALTVIAQQQAAGDEVTVALLPGAPTLMLPAGVHLQRVPEQLAWDALLERIFAADQVIAW